VYPWHESDKPTLFMVQAACCIVSSNHNEHFDAYVLSESSLFVYEDKLVLKTCGTTRLLAAVPTILQLAAGLDMGPRRCKYSRASFLFPEQQVRWFARRVFCRTCGPCESRKRRTWVEARAMGLSVQSPRLRAR
jgi:hypothetical protein